MCDIIKLQSAWTTRKYKQKEAKILRLTKMECGITNEITKGAVLHHVCSTPHVFNVFLGVPQQYLQLQIIMILYFTKLYFDLFFPWPSRINPSINDTIEITHEIWDIFFLELKYQQNICPSSTVTTQTKLILKTTSITRIPLKIWFTDSIT